MTLISSRVIHNPQVQTEKEVQRRTRQAQGPGSCKRRHVTPGDDQSQHTSITIMPLTFALFLQLAVIQQLHMATIDIKSAYLISPLSGSRLDRNHCLCVRSRPCTKISHCNRIIRLARLGPPVLSALQDISPRRRRLHDVCVRQLLILYVDDTFIFSNSPVNIEHVITNVGDEHYEVKLNRDATSFLGLNLTHNADGTVTITQYKLLTKLFSLYLPQKDTTHKPSHPYSPLPTRRPLRLFATPRYTPLSHQEPPGYHGYGIIRGNEEQQPNQLRLDA